MRSFFKSSKFCTGGERSKWERPRKIPACWVNTKFAFISSGRRPCCSAELFKASPRRSSKFPGAKGWRVVAKGNGRSVGPSESNLQFGKHLSRNVMLVDHSSFHQLDQSHLEPQWIYLSISSFYIYILWSQLHMSQRFLPSTQLPNSLNPGHPETLRSLSQG